MSWFQRADNGEIRLGLTTAVGRLAAVKYTGPKIDAATVVWSCNMRVVGAIAVITMELTLQADAMDSRFATHAHTLRSLSNGDRFVLGHVQIMDLVPEMVLVLQGGTSTVNLVALEESGLLVRVG